MYIQKFLIVSLGLAIQSISAFGAIRTETINYKIGANEFQGVISYNDSIKGRRPTVLIVHEWMGQGDYEVRRAKEIAALGYLAFAVDVYGKGIRAKNVEEAGKLATTYKSNRPEMRMRAKGALDFISKNSMYDPKRVAAIGYCFGGTVSLEMARAGLPINGVVSFHGGLDTAMPAIIDSVKAKVLVLHGADDTYVPAKDVEGFENEMRAAKADWELVKFGGAVHGFSKKEAGSNTASGYAYNAQADRRSFEIMKNFLSEIFQN